MRSRYLHTQHAVLRMPSMRRENMQPAKETQPRSHTCNPLIHNQKVLSIMLSECYWQGFWLDRCTLQSKLKDGSWNLFLKPHLTSPKNNGAKWNPCQAHMKISWVFVKPSRAAVMSTRGKILGLELAHHWQKVRGTEVLHGYSQILQSQEHLSLKPSFKILSTA